MRLCMAHSAHTEQTFLTRIHMRLSLFNTASIGSNKASNGLKSYGDCLSFAKYNNGRFYEQVFSMVTRFYNSWSGNI
jgi:hypothetical protein